MVSSLIAAGVALVVAAITVAVAGRRETRKWIRDQTLAQLDEFAKASFDSQINPAWDARGVEGLSGAAVAAFREKSDETRRRKREALTLLRLTASWREIVAAEQLYHYEEYLHDFVYTQARTDGSDKLFASGKKRHNELRDNLFNAARMGLHLSPGPPLTNRYVAGDLPAYPRQEPEWQPPIRPSRRSRTWKRIRSIDCF